MVEFKFLGGVVLFSIFVLVIMCKYGVDVLLFGFKIVIKFVNNKGKICVILFFNKDVEKLFGIFGWYYGMLCLNVFG